MANRGHGRTKRQDDNQKSRSEFQTESRVRTVTHEETSAIFVTEVEIADFAEFQLNLPSHKRPRRDKISVKAVS